MTKRIAPVPRGYRTVTPQIVVQGADAALAFYAEVFGAVTLSRTLADDGLSVLQAEMKVGNSIIRIMDEMPGFGIFSPLAFGGTAVGMHLYMVNADEIWDRAVTHGAGILVPFADMPWDERYGKFIDPFGHVWSVARRLTKQTATKATNAGLADVGTDTNTGPFSVHEPRADVSEPSIEQKLVANSAAA